jgi:hypothetical protein
MKEKTSFSNISMNFLILLGCIKDKINAFYTMLYVRTKFLELTKYYNFKENKLDLQEIKKYNKI